MAFVKGFDINGINTIQTACIELQGRPNAATEGAVGLLAIDMSSHTKDVYKCVKVEGAIYTWELLSSGMSILNSSESGNGIATATFTYSAIRMTDKYVVKVGDLILDSKGYLYRITRLNNTYCEAEYCNLFLNRDGVGISKVEQTLISNESGAINRVTVKLTDKSEYSFDVKNGQTAYQLAVEKGYKGTEEEWLENIGYDSWLKGRAVTQAEYDALPTEEKDKPGYMYVVKDAPVEVDHATTADSLTLTKTISVICSNGGVTPVDVIEGKWYLIRMDVEDDGVMTYHTGLICIPSTQSFSSHSSYMGYGDDETYICDVRYNSSERTWKIGIVKSVGGSTSRASGNVTLIPIC